MTSTDALTAARFLMSIFNSSGPSLAYGDSNRRNISATEVTKYK